MSTPIAAKPPQAPADLSALRQMLTDLQRDPSQGLLGKRALEVLAQILDSPQQAAMGSITELADNADVHASTLSRLVRSLGYRNFSEFQGVFRDHLTGSGHFYTQQADRLFHQQNNDVAELVARVVSAETSNINRMLADMDTNELSAAAQLLANAKRVRTHGLRQSFAIACYFSYVLGLLRNDVAFLGSQEHGVAHALAQLEVGDVLLVVGCAPYTRGTVQAAQMAADHGLPVIAFTDSHASPLGLNARHVFIAPATGNFVSNSMAAFVVQAESLLALVARELGDSAIKALEHREALITEQQIELGGH